MALGGGMDPDESAGRKDCRLMKTLSRFAPVALAAATALAGPAGCSPADAPPAPALPSAASTYTLSTADAALIQQIDETDLEQIAVAGLAATNSNSDVIKAFAERLKTDHGVNRKAVAKIASDANLTLTDKLSAEDEESVSALSHHYGAAFDRLFLRAVRDADSVRLSQALTTAQASGGTADIKTLASDTRKMLSDHTQRADDLGGVKTIGKHRRQLHWGSGRQWVGKTQ